MRYFLLALLCLIAIGCTADNQDQQAIQAVMLQRQQALRSKDLDTYLRLISLNYQSKGQDFAAMKKELAANFAAFDSVDYRSDGYEITIAGDDATVAGGYGLRIVKGGQLLKVEGTEEIRLHKEQQVWRIVSGL